MNYQREMFTSFSGDLGVIHLVADTDRALNFSLGMNRPEPCDDLFGRKGLADAGTTAGRGGYVGDERDAFRLSCPYRLAEGRRFGYDR